VGSAAAPPPRNAPGRPGADGGARNTAIRPVRGGRDAGRGRRRRGARPARQHCGPQRHRGAVGDRRARAGCASGAPSRSARDRRRRSTTATECSRCVVATAAGLPPRRRRGRHGRPASFLGHADTGRAAAGAAQCGVRAGTRRIGSPSLRSGRIGCVAGRRCMLQRGPPRCRHCTPEGASRAVSPASGTPASAAPRWRCPGTATPRS
jgi:hypothetical protein